MEHLEEEISKVATAMANLGKSKLNNETIEVLIQHKTKVSRKDIRLVLDAAANLERICFKKGSFAEDLKKI